MTEVIVVSEGGTRESGLEVGKSKARFETAPQHRYRRILVLPLDRGDERLFVVRPDGVGERVTRLAQHVVGDMGDPLQHAGETLLFVVFVLVVEGEPVRDPCVGMGPAELHPIVGPVNGLAHRVEGVGVEAVQARDLARHALV